MPTVPPKPTPIREIDFGHYVRHYASLLWRWKWWIGISGPVVTGVALLYILKFSPPEPELEAKALIGLENTANMTAVMDFVEVDNSKAALITTSNFLQDIVRRLSLQLQVRKCARNAIFETILVDSLAKPGKYIFTIDKDTMALYTITFTNRKMGYINKIVGRGKLATLSSINLPGIHLKFTSSFLKDPRDVSMSIVSLPKTIEVLKNDIIVNGPDPRRQRYHIEVALKGRDYNLIADILNAIADAFVEKNLMFRKRKTQNVLVALEKQFKRAKLAHSQSESRLRNFRTANPTVGLTQSAQQTVSTMTELETGAFTIKSALKDAQDLQSKFNNASKEDEIQIAEEILIFLVSQNNIAAPVLQMELNRIVAEKRGLAQNYANNHPLIQKKKSEIERITNKVSNELIGYIKSAQEEAREKSSGIQSLSNKLQRLPSKELHMAELQRQHQVSAQIYSTVLDRYNQAKVSETVEVADVYVMDYAVPPIPPPVNLLKILAICLLIACAVSLCPPVIFDMINKTVRTETELRKMTDMIVLEAIPEIVPARSEHERKIKKEKR